LVRISGVIRETVAKSLLTRQKRIDSWFVAPFGMNLYRGCTHGCVYCDGRAERYYVDGEFGHDVTVKVNALDLLRRELDPSRRRKPLARGYVFLGGGVGDSYQPAEEIYRLARGALEILLEHGRPVHVLTKSTRVLEDADLIRRIHERSAAVVSVSLSSVDEALSAMVEPGVPSPLERLEVLRRFKELGVPCGVYLMPILPGLSDSPEQLEAVLGAVNETGVDFLCFGGLTLREGRQKGFYLESLGRWAPEQVRITETLYPPNPWGQPKESYAGELSRRFYAVSRRYPVPLRLPPELYWSLLNENDRLMVALEHIEYLLKIRGRRSAYGRAARTVGTLEEPISEVRKQIPEMQRLQGVDHAAAQVITEMLDTGRSQLYETLLRPWLAADRHRETER
jgi:DNA repair photolyase